MLTKTDAYFEYASFPPTADLPKVAPHFHRKNMPDNIFEAFFVSESFKKIAADFPTGTHDAATTKGLFKRLIFEVQVFLEKTSMRISWESPAGKTNEVASLVIYDCEDDVVTITPMTIGRAIIRVGTDDIFMPHSRAVTLLTRALINLISKTQAGAA